MTRSMFVRGLIVVLLVAAAFALLQVGIAIRL